MSRALSTPCTFVHDGRVYTSPTRSSFPPYGPPSPTEDSSRSSHVSPSTWERCMWAKRDFLELAFYPTSTHLDGELFRHLRFFRRNAIPLDKRSNPGSSPQYRLAHALQLYDIEVTLFHVRKTLLDQIGFLVGLEKTNVPGPSSESYTSWFVDEATARNRAFFARKKFLYHIAVISLYIAIITYRTGDPHRWYSLLIEQGVPGTIADKLSSTMVSDLSPNVLRAGVFVCPDQDTAEWEFYIRVLIAANVPIFISWGPVDAWVLAKSSPSVLPCFAKLQPTKSSVEAALRTSGDASPGGGDFLYPSTLGAGSYPDLPPPESLPDSPLDEDDDQASYPSQYTWKGRPLLHGEQPPSPPKYLPSDTPASFFSRRAAARAEYIATIESQRQKDCRLEREKNAWLYLVPEIGAETGHDEVYEWDFDHNIMRWKRLFVPRGERETIWQLFSSACKCYDSVAGEWDIADFLDYSDSDSGLSTVGEIRKPAGEEVQDHDNLMHERQQPCPFFREGDYHVAPSVPPFGPSQDRPSETMSMSESTTEHSISSLPPSDVVDSSVVPIPPDHVVNWEANEQEVPNFVSFMEALINFYAFRWGSSTIKPLKRISLRDACKMVGFHLPYHGTGLLFEMENRNGADMFVAWVSRMLDKRNPPPADWWHLHRDSAFKLKRVLWTKGYPLRISVLRTADDDKLWWCLHKRSDHQSPWFIAVGDPTAAVAAIQSRIGQLLL